MVENRSPAGGPAGGASRRQQAVTVLATVAEAHRRMMVLCDTLEAVADSLPSRIDRMTCLRVAGEMVPFLRDVHSYEEDTLFPAYAVAAQLLGRSAASIQRLRAEHIEDECFAGELTEALLALGHGAAPANPEALGFMLRGFFESKRRHIAFEREHVMPMIDAAEAGSEAP